MTKMEGKRKPIRTQSLGSRTEYRTYFSTEDKHKIIQEYLSSGCTKREIWKKYTNKYEEHGQILAWMRQLGYLSHGRAPQVPQNEPMKEEETKAESFETLQLEKRIELLEKQLKDAEMKAIAYSTLIDIAEKELKINIRKKYNTKPLNK